MEEKPKRRWLRFSLRTLLLAVAVTCAGLAWLGWQVSIVRARNTFVSQIRSQGGVCVPLDKWPEHIQNGLNVERPPLARRWLGDKAWMVIEVPESTSAEFVSKVEKTFPESIVEHGLSRDSNCSWPVLR
jgi:hypothetical protein